MSQEQVTPKIGPTFSPPLSHDFIGTRTGTSEPQDCLSCFRARTWTQLERTPLPHPGEELWRYTTPEQLELERVFSGESRSIPDTAVLLEFASRKPAAIPGVQFLSGIEQIAPRVPEIEAALNATSGKLRDHATNDAFCDALSLFQIVNSASFAYLRVARNQKITQSLLLSSLVAKGNISGMFAPIVIVHVESGATLSLVEDLDFALTGFFLPRIEFIVEANAQLDFTSIQHLPVTTNMVARHRVRMARDARVKFFHIALGGQASRLDFDCALTEPGGHAELYSVYLADGDRRVDLHPTQIHAAPNCHSNLYSKGVVRDQARAAYFGYIRVAEGAQKTDAYQKNKNLLLSSEARADSVPNLEIKANDVKCSHGSSIGQISAEDLFYLMSRGLTRDQAHRLLVEAFFEDLMPKIADQQVRDFVHTLIMSRL